MKSFKLLSRLFAVLGMTMIVAISSSAACEGGAATGTWTTDILPYQSGSQAVKGIAANSDNYIINADENGSLVVTINNTDSTQNLTAYIYSGDQCSGTALSSITINNGNYANLIVDSVTSGQSYSVWITGSSTSNNTDYNLSIGLSNIRPFEIIHQSNFIGDVKMFGNANLCKNNGSGQCATTIDTTANNNGTDTLFYKLATDSGDVTISNSTSYTFAFPSGVTKSDVVWAGLYWQAGIKGVPTAGQIANSKNVKLKAPGDANYRNITAETSNGTHTNRFNWFVNPKAPSAALSWYYQGIREITDVVKTQGAGTYQVANIEATYGNAYDAGDFAGWAIVMVYRDSTSTFKNVTVYDGYGVVNNTGSSVDTNLTGFLTPSSATVNSKFMIFGSEGDSATYTGDKISLTQGSLSGTQYYLKADGTATSTSGNYNPMNSSITMGAGDSRVPAYDNALGIDIDTYNVGSTGSGIITNNQTGTRVRLTTSNDIYNPGVFVFSTDLYQPNMCYEETLFNSADTNISGVGVKVNKDDILKVRVTVKNNGTETAKGVQVLHTFDNAKFPYKTGTTSYDNFNSSFVHTQVTPASDSSGNDLFDYDGINLGKIRLGKDANSTDGGEFITYSSNNQAYAVYEYNATVKQFDQNFTNEYYAAYKSSIDGGLDYSNYPVKMELCSGVKNSFYGYSAPVSATGDFNVVYANNGNGALSSGYYYNLPTAIASRADNYKVIALNTGTDILKDVNTTVAVELVDASSGSCSTYTPISSVKTWIPFHSSTANFSAADIINGVILADPQAAVKFYQKAGKNVKFRISYPNDGSGGTIVMEETVANKYHLVNFPSYAGNTCVYPVTATTYNPANGNVQGESTYTQVPQACGNAGASGASALTQHEVNVCLECIYGANVNYTCSRDNFAIRPEAFYVKLSDQNQTNFVTKQVMSNNISGAVALNLASGYKYYAEVNATNHINNNAASGYTTTEGLDSIWTPGATVVTGCNDDTNKSSVLNFVNGSVETNLSVDQVGKYNLNITDDQWANVDSNVSTMTHHTSPLFLSGTDCTLNSGVTSVLGTYNGCNISSNHVNSDAGITYVDTSVTYRPYDFNLSSIQMSKGQSFGGTIMGQNSWTYINNVNVDENMSVRYFGPIKAEGKTGTLLSNFVNNCYAQPINFESNLTFPIAANLQKWHYRLQEVNASNQVWNDTNAAFLSPVSSLTFNLLTVPASSFLKDKNGLIDVNLSLNFDRNQTATINPITVGLQNFQIKCNPLADCSSRADFSTTHLPDANVTTDNNTTFVYGRVIPRDVRVFGSVPFSANGWYEVFNAPSIGATTLPASKNDASWYTNTLHLQPSDGIALVTVVPGGSLPTTTTYASGVVSYNFNAINALNIPYSAKAHIDTDPWLWYGTNALSYLDPANPGNVDCMTHPCFNINVVPAVGATGSAKSGAETKKASKKSTSEVGAGGWKSTSDYAPAIR